MPRSGIVQGSNVQGSNVQGSNVQGNVFNEIVDCPIECSRFVSRFSP
jgi:hypothetical protein